MPNDKMPADGQLMDRRTLRKRQPCSSYRKDRHFQENARYEGDEASEYSDQHDGEDDEIYDEYDVGEIVAQGRSKQHRISTPGASTRSQGRSPSNVGSPQFFDIEQTVAQVVKETARNVKERALEDQVLSSSLTASMTTALLKTAKELVLRRGLYEFDGDTMKAVILYCAKEKGVYAPVLQIIKKPKSKQARRLKERLHDVAARASRNIRQAIFEKMEIRLGRMNISDVVTREHLYWNSTTYKHLDSFINQPFIKNMCAALRNNARADMEIFQVVVDAAIAAYGNLPSDLSTFSFTGNQPLYDALSNEQEAYVRTTVLCYCEGRTFSSHGENSLFYERKRTAHGHSKASESRSFCIDKTWKEDFKQQLQRVASERANSTDTDETIAERFKGIRSSVSEVQDDACEYEEELGEEVKAMVKEWSTTSNT